MRKIFYAFVWCCGCGIVIAGEKVTVSSGGAVRANTQVKVISIGSPAPRFGLTYVGKKKIVAGARQTAPTAVKIESSGINSSFVFGEVYVYPNPAKGGQIPTFHVESGIADSIKITVYTVSGDVAHSYVITGLPGVINDGNGMEYAYEYAWRDHIPSGVYYFTIEAQKAGKKLRKTGKFAVLR